MPNWKKVIVSGSDASLNTLNVNGASGSFSGSFQGDGSQLTGTDPFPYTGSALITGSLTVNSNSTSETLRITQIGTGDAIRIEDSTNPDATPTVITKDGDMYIGSSSAVSTGGGVTPKLYIKNGSSGYTGNLAIDTAMLFEGAGSTYFATLSPDAFVSGLYMASPSDVFGAFVRWGYDDGRLQLGAAQVGHGIEFTVGNKSATSMQLRPDVSATGDYNATLTVTGSVVGTQTASFGTYLGDGSQLTDVPVTVTNTLWVSPAGDNSTAIKGNLQRPWASVREAVGAASSGDSVLMEPGTYIESPFTVPNGVTLKSIGSLKSATISASNNSATFITQEANTRLEGFTLVCPSGSFPGIFYDSVGGGTIYDVTFKGQGNSIGLQISQSTATTSKVIFNEFRYGGGDFDKLAYVQGGILATDGVHVPGGGNIDKIFHTTAGRLQAINTNAGNPAVSSSFYNEGGTNIVLGTNLFNVQEAFHLASQDYTIQGMNVYIDDNVDKHITIDAGISGSDSSVFNLVSSHMQAAKITANPDWVSSNHAFSFQDDGVTLEPAFRIYSDVEVGHANKGFTFGAGEGLPYNKGMKIINSGSTGFTDVTTEATSRDSSTFEFTYSGSGDAMYIGNVQKDPTIDDLYLYFTGLQYKQVSTGSYSPGDLTLEIYTTASTWEAIGGAQCVSSEEGYNYSSNIFAHNNSQEEIIANVNTDVWATSSFFSTEARWGRIRVVNPLTTSPIFEQFLFAPNTTLINPKGQLSFRGKALSRQTVPIIGNTWGSSGLGNGDLANVAGDASWDHALPGVQLNQGSDEAYNQLTIPAGTCTAFPLEITIGYYANGATGGAELDVVLIKGNGVLVNDPDGGKIPTARTLANSDTFDDASLTVTTLTTSFTSNNTLQYKTYGPIDISNYYEGDTILIRQRKGSAAGTFDIVTTEASFVKWTAGERE